MVLKANLFQEIKYNFYLKEIGEKIHEKIRVINDPK